MKNRDWRWVAIAALLWAEAALHGALVVRSLLFSGPSEPVGPLLYFIAGTTAWRWSLTA